MAMQALKAYGGSKEISGNYAQSRTHYGHSAVL